MDDPNAGFAEVVWLQTDRIRPNNYNPNKMPPEALARYVRRVLETQQLPRPVLVREVEGEHELIDGEYTLTAAMAAGMGRVPAHVLPLTRLEAMREANRRNTHGMPHPVLKGRQYAEMKVLGNLSNSALAEWEGRTEGTVRNFLAYGEAAEVRARYAVPLGRTMAEIDDEVGALTVRDMRTYLSKADDTRDAWLDAAGSAEAEAINDTPAPKANPRGRKSLARRAAKQTPKKRQGDSTTAGSQSLVVNVEEQDRVATPTGVALLTLTREGDGDLTVVQDDAVSPRGPGMAGLLESVERFVAIATPEELRQLVAALLAHAGTMAIIEDELHMRRAAEAA